MLRYVPMNIVYVREPKWRQRYQLKVARSGDEIVARIPARWGEAETQGMLYRHRRWLQLREQELRLRVEKSAVRKQAVVGFCELDESWYRKAAKVVLKRRCDIWAQRMGLRYGALRITGAVTRWGSCSSRGNLSFSWRLLATRWDLLEYVVVHELAHRVHFDHSSRFWGLVGQYIPDYMQRRKDLRTLGADLG